MTVYLCGASGSESGGIVGIAGDQTGREVRRTKWYQYSPQWTYVLRAQDRAKADAIAEAAEQGAANDHIGYDQTNRNDLLAKLERYGSMKAIPVDTETDCTAFASCCLIQAGFSKAKLYSGGNLPYSRNIDTKALACGGISKLTATLYTKSSDYLERGDILVCYGHHAEVVVTSGARASRSVWRKGAKGWYYLRSDGKMAREAWIADSHGYCWLGADGYWVKGTRWLHIGGDWYHITNGYQDRNAWKRDSKGWCYVGSGGKMLRDAWRADSHGWCYLGSDGRWTASRWVDWKGARYYIKANHYMAAGCRLVIDGVEYAFGKDGKLIG